MNRMALAYGVAIVGGGLVLALILALSRLGLPGGLEQATKATVQGSAYSCPGGGELICAPCPYGTPRAQCPCYCSYPTVTPSPSASAASNTASPTPSPSVPAAAQSLAPTVTAAASPAAAAVATPTASTGPAWYQFWVPRSGGSDDIAVTSPVSASPAATGEVVVGTPEAVATQDEDDDGGETTPARVTVSPPSNLTILALFLEELRQLVVDGVRAVGSLLGGS